MGVWIVVFIALALMGSFFWILPSPRDRKRMELRQKAMRLGLKVRFPDKGLKERLVRFEDQILGAVMYELFIVTRKKPALTGSFFIIKDEEGWRFIERSLPLNLQNISESILGELKLLPDNFDLIMLSSNGTSVFWDERGEDEYVDQLYGVMTGLNTILSSIAP